MAKHFLVCSFCALALPIVVVGADAKDATREIELKDFKPTKIPQGSITKPVVITDAKGLKDVFEDAKVRDEVMKKVDFSKEKLLFFRWSGSGGDKLQFEAKDGTVMFRARPGLTDDIKAHFHLFAIPKDATWKMAGK